MYGLGYDLVVVDEEFPDLGVALQTMADTFEAKLKAYQESLSRIVAGAVKEGVVAENLVDFKGRASGLTGEARRLADEVKQILSQYVTDIDRADKQLY